MTKEIESKKSTRDILSQIDCSDKVEQKDAGGGKKLTYLSWAWAWGITKKYFPDMNYEVVEYNGKPYLLDEDLGYLITTKVTIDGQTIQMSLPVLDSSNKAQKNKPYTYATKFGDKNVGQATMFDINTAIMRCLTKNLAMFGLGHYIYAGEDIPEKAEDDGDKIPEPKKTEVKKVESKTESIEDQVNKILKELIKGYTGTKLDKRKQDLMSIVGVASKDELLKIINEQSTLDKLSEQLLKEQI